MSFFCFEANESTPAPSSGDRPRRSTADGGALSHPHTRPAWARVLEDIRSSPTLQKFLNRSALNRRGLVLARELSRRHTSASITGETSAKRLNIRTFGRQSLPSVVHTNVHLDREGTSSQRVAHKNKRQGPLRERVCFEDKLSKVMKRSSKAFHYRV